MGKKKNKVKLILNNDNDISRIFVTMLYNAQRSISEEVDNSTSELLQTLLLQVPLDLIHQISKDEQTLALIEHWNLSHIALKDMLKKCIKESVMELAPTGAHPKHIQHVIDGRIEEAMTQASLRATESMRRVLEQTQEINSIKRMIVVSMD